MLISKSSQAFLIVGLLLAVVALSGCGRSEIASSHSDLPPEGRQVGPEESFSDQMSRGQQGMADRVTLFETGVDDETVTSLSGEDAWLEVLILDAGRITDVGVQSIASLPSLWHLRLRKSPLTDAGMQQLAGCSSLRILNLPQCDASAKGVEALAQLPMLQQLRIGGLRLGPETAHAVAGIKTLKNLHLIGIPIDDEGLKEIAQLPKLESLYLDDSRVSESGWDWLFDSYPELHIHINQRHHDRDSHRRHDSDAEQETAAD